MIIIPFTWPEVNVLHHVGFLNAWWAKCQYQWWFLTDNAGNAVIKLFWILLKQHQIFFDRGKIDNFCGLTTNAAVDSKLKIRLVEMSCFNIFFLNCRSL